MTWQLDCSIDIILFNCSDSHIGGEGEATGTYGQTNLGCTIWSKYEDGFNQGEIQRAPHVCHVTCKPVFSHIHKQTHTQIYFKNLPWLLTFI